MPPILWVHHAKSSRGSGGNSHDSACPEPLRYGRLGFSAHHLKTRSSRHTRTRLGRTTSGSGNEGFFLMTALSRCRVTPKDSASCSEVTSLFAKSTFLHDRCGGATNQLHNGCANAMKCPGACANRPGRGQNWIGVPTCKPYLLTCEPTWTDGSASCGEDSPPRWTESEGASDPARCRCNPGHHPSVPSPRGGAHRLLIGFTRRHPPGRDRATTPAVPQRYPYALGVFSS